MAQVSIESPYLTAAEAATFLRLEERTLNNMRWRGEGPHWRKHGGKVIYHRLDLEGWSRENDFGDGPSYDIKSKGENDNEA
ncbi:helix-turn-helix domain-containing protein [Hyphomonas sp.]|uniref:helix-turn-helix domain-containing protein n=1 Tax=Hyphomonas sp. TaxID=87 RepID=UPI0025C2BD35|nr:helix-turn-helix domain-containing protein [Hyphomonas sp.]